MWQTVPIMSGRRGGVNEDSVGWSKRTSILNSIVGLQGVNTRNTCAINNIFKEENEGVQNRERKEREEGKVRERVREKVREGRRAGEGDCAETPCGLRFPHLPRSPAHSTLGQTNWNPGALQCSLPLSWQVLSQVLPAPALASCRALYSLISENQQGPHCWPHWLQIVSEGTFCNGFSLFWVYSRNVNSFRLA